MHDVDSRYGWRRLAASTALSMFGSFGLWGVVVIFPSLQSEFAASRADVAFSYSTTMVGFGAGAIYTLARDLKRRGVRVSAIVGARSKDLVILQDEMQAVSDHFYVCTDDGSFGYKGFVTGFLRDMLESDSGFTVCYAIGPIAMMRALAEVTQPYGLRTMVSLDPIMVDGTGMCGGCRVTVGDQTYFACVDGPDFDGSKVNWDELMSRLDTYKRQERFVAEHTCKIGYGRMVS